MSRAGFEGAAGVVFSLEGVLVDLRPVFQYSYSILAEDLRREQPSSLQVNDVIGMPFAEALVALQWGVPKESAAAVERRFGDIFLKVVEAMPVSTFAGSEMLLDELLRAKNQVVLNTFLPRELAMKAIAKSRLADLLEGRVPGENLIFPSPDYPSPLRGQQLVRCCGVMRKPTVSIPCQSTTSNLSAKTLVVSIDSNSRTVLDAKRDGIASIAVKGMAANGFLLRSADLIVDSLRSLRAKEIYHVVALTCPRRDVSSPHRSSNEQSRLRRGRRPRRPPRARCRYSTLMGNLATN